MAKEIPLTIETLSQNDDELHRITSAKEIEFVMAYIAEKGTRVALYYDDGNNFHLTTLLAADSTGLWLEQSPSNTVNLRISLSKRLVFVSSHFQVKVQFIAEQAHSVLFRGYPAFFISLPANLFRLQRREYFRLLTPVENPPHCVIAAGAAATKKAAQLFPIMDISCGGVGLTCLEKDTVFTPGVTYPDCLIELPELGTIIGTIEVRNRVSVTTEAGHMLYRIGCEFKNLDGSSAILLQRYVTLIQRIKAKT